MAGVGGAGGGGSKGGGSAGRAGGSRGGSKAGGGNKGGKAGKTAKSAKTGAKADASKAKATKDAAKAKAAAEVKSELAKDRVSTDKSQQQAEKAVKATEKSATEQKARQESVDKAVQAAKTAETTKAADPINDAKDRADIVSKSIDVAAGLGKSSAVAQGLGSIGTTIAKGIETGQQTAKTIDAIQNGDTSKALNEGGKAVISGVQTLAAAANTPLGKLAKIGSRFGGPAAALSLASDAANFTNSYAKAVNEGGIGNWTNATVDAAKTALSAASLAPGVGVVPGAIAGAIDLGQMAFNGISSWLGS